MSVGVVPAEPAELLPPIVAYLETVRTRHAGNDTGEVARYIPELANVDPALFGICLATVGGTVYEIGDTDVPFTLQSISKPLTYGLALSVVGEARIRERIGVEPSGDPFNEISLDPATRIPVNPMINAGAIACAGLIVSASDDAEGLLLDAYSSYAGRRLARSTRPSIGPRPRPAIGTGRSHTCSGASVPSRSTRSLRSTSTSGSARLPWTAATSRSWRRRSRTAASTRARGCARFPRTTSAAC